MTTTQTETEAFQEQLQTFAEHYDYDCSYLFDLLQRTPAGFAAFNAARSMTGFREQLPVEAHFVAAVTVMQHKDCGSCLQLNLKMAREQGVERELLQALLESPDMLPRELQDVRQHAAAVAADEDPDPAVAERIKAHFGEAAFGELALCIATVPIYPGLKRALLMTSSCQLPTLDF